MRPRDIIYTLAVLICGTAVSSAQFLINPYAFAAGGGGGGGDITVDLWQTFEFDTINSGNFDANDNTTTGSWSTDTTYLATSATGERVTSSLINSVADTGTRGLSRVYTTSATATPTFDIGSGNTKTTISAGHWFRYDGDPGVNKRVLLFYGSSAEMVRVDFLYAADRVGFNGGTDIGAALAEDTFYWITVQATQNATSYLRVYDTAGALVGSEATVTAANQPFRYWQTFGSAEAQDTGITFFWDDLILDWTDATFPLGP